MRLPQAIRNRIKHNPVRLRCPKCGAPRPAGTPREDALCPPCAHEKDPTQEWEGSPDDGS